MNQIKEKLWDSLFADKQFYAREFLRDYSLNEIIVDFYCPEAQFGVCLMSNRNPGILSGKLKKQYAESGIHLTIIDEWELEIEYQKTIDYISREFTGLLRFQCN